MMCLCTDQIYQYHIYACKKGIKTSIVINVLLLLTGARLFNAMFTRLPFHYFDVTVCLFSEIFKFLCFLMEEPAF